MRFLIRRAAVRLAFGGAGALGNAFGRWRRALAPRSAPAPAPARISAPRRPF